MTGRFLYRLARSAYRDRFVLKGAKLFRLWDASPHRPTRDLDPLGHGKATEEAVQRVFGELIQSPDDPPDGLEWGEVQTMPIRDEISYGGVRATLKASLAGARLNLQVDVGFGDAITPEAEERDWHALLDFPSARLLVYPPETVIAEKLEAAVSLGMQNSRMKDLYDLHWLQANLDFEGRLLTEAINNTFTRRGTELPRETPIALTAAFSADRQKQLQWNAFLRKGGLTYIPLDQVISDLSQFLLPVLNRQVSQHQWTPSQHWQKLPSLS